MKKDNLSQGGLPAPVEVTLEKLAEKRPGQQKKKRTAAPMIAAHTRQVSIFK